MQMSEGKSCKYLDADNTCACTGGKPSQKLAFCKAEENCDSCQWYRSADALGLTPEGLWEGREALEAKEQWAEAAPEEAQPTATEEKTCLCVGCTCTGCHEECYGHCQGCGKPVTDCNSHQTEGAKWPQLTAADEPEALPAPKPSGVGGDRDVLPTPAPEPPAAPAAQELPVFDTTGLDAQTVVDLEFAEREYRSGLRLAESGLRRMADGVAIAHEALVGNSDKPKQKNQYVEQVELNDTVVANCENSKRDSFSKYGNRGEDTFRRWCAYMGLSKDAAYRMLNVSTLFDQSSPKQQKLLEALPPSLLYAAAKPSAPPQLVEGVKAGDITTHKQYREMEEKLKAAEKAKREAERRAQAAEDKAYSAILHGREASNRAHEAEGRRLEAEERAQAAEKHVSELQARPVEVVGASPEDIARWKAEGEQAANDRLAAEAAAAAADAAKAREEAAKARKQVKKMADTLQGRTDHLASVEAELARVKAQLAAAVAAAAPAAAPQGQVAAPSAPPSPGQMGAPGGRGATLPGPSGSTLAPGQAGAAVVPVEGLQLTRCAKQYWGLADAAALAARPLVPCSECVYDPYCSGVYLDDKAFDHLEELGINEDQLDCVLDLLTGCTMGKRKGAGQ